MTVYVHSKSKLLWIFNTLISEDKYTLRFAYRNLHQEITLNSVLNTLINQQASNWNLEHTNRDSNLLFKTNKINKQYWLLRYTDRADDRIQGLRPHVIVGVLPRQNLVDYHNAIEDTRRFGFMNRTKELRNFCPFFMNEMKFLVLRKIGWLLVLYLRTCYTWSHLVWFYLIPPGITVIICNVLVTQRARDRSRQIRWRVARWLCVASNKRRDFFSSFLFSFFYLDLRFTRSLGNLLNRSWTRSTNDKTKNIPACFLRSATQFLLRYVLIMFLFQASNWKILS